MSDTRLRSSDDALWDQGYLADYRETVERLRGETVAELGCQPMLPEKLSMIATAVACLPLVALLLPAVPVEPNVWQVGVVQFAVWITAFQIQRLRYARFHEVWQQKVAAYAADPQPAARRGPRGGSGHCRWLQRGPSGQTTGAAAAL